MAAKDRKRGGGTVVVRKEEIVEAAHHGGAWKVAYADFVTAMMAFFLLMWLLNATTEEQRRGLADYFTPMNVLSRNTSGTGQPFGGRTPYEQGPMASDRGAQPILPGKSPPPPDEVTDTDENFPAPAPPKDVTGGHAPEAGRAGQVEVAHGNAASGSTEQGERAPGGGVAAAQAQTPSKAEFLAHAGAGAAAKAEPQTLDEAALRTELQRRENEAFEKAAEQIRAAVRADPALADLSRQLAIDITPDGLRIQLLDEDKQPMFASGSSSLSDKAQLLLSKVAPILGRLPEPLMLTGHTDATPFNGNGRTNWELSSERANAARRVLVDGGLSEDRFKEVSGRADRDPLLPSDPFAAVNRRIAIVVKRTYAAQ